MWIFYQSASSSCIFLLQIGKLSKTREKNLSHATVVCCASEVKQEVGNLKLWPRLIQNENFLITKVRGEKNFEGDSDRKDLFEWCKGWLYSVIKMFQCYTKFQFFGHSNTGNTTKFFTDTNSIPSGSKKFFFYFM